MEKEKTMFEYFMPRLMTSASEVNNPRNPGIIAMQITVNKIPWITLNRIPCVAATSAF